MKSRYYLMALPLAASLVFPVAAQQSNSQQEPDQNKATTATTSEDQNLSARQPLEPQTHEGFWGHLNPFARKKYIGRQLDPVRNRVNELDELTAKNTQSIKDVDARLQAGLQQAGAKANDADMHAVEAGNRAQMAQQTAQQATTHLQTVEQTVANLDQYQKVSDTEIRFRPGNPVLSDKAKSAIDEIAQTLQGKAGYIVEIQGHSSGQGPAATASSRRMADAVVRYLVINHQVPLYRIHTVALGNEQKEANGQRLHGGSVVEVSLLKNSLSDLASASPATPAEGTNPQTQNPVPHR